MSMAAPVMIPPARGIVVVPIGDVPAVPIADLIEDMQVQFSPMGVKKFSHEQGVLEIPPTAWNESRRQYSTTVLLKLLGRHKTDYPRQFLLGVVNVDIYAAGMTFLFGQADLSGGVALISVTRLYPAYYSSPYNPSGLRRRIRIEAAHEVGHLLGYGHCENRHCVMYRSEVLYDSDVKGFSLCADCKKLNLL